MKTSVAVVQIGHSFKREPKTVHDYEALSQIDLDLGEKTSNVVDFLKSTTHYFFSDNEIQAFKTRENLLQILITGQFSWNQRVGDPSIKLATLNAEKLKEVYPRERGGHFYRLVPGLNPYSECWNAVWMMKRSEIKECTIVASVFYLKAYALMWKFAAMRAGVYLSCAPVYHETGVVPREVLKHHQSFGVKFLSYLAESSASGHKLAMRLADSSGNMSKNRGSDVHVQTKTV